MFDLSKLSPEQRKQVEEKLKQMSPEELQELVKQQCPFCKIASGEIKAATVFDTKGVMAVLDARPANPGHVLIFPKEHYNILQQVPDEDVARIFSLAKYMSSAVFAATEAQGTNIIVSSGAVAGQGVPHVIIHVIPRFEEDGMPVQFWQPKEVKEDQMKEMQKRIAEALKNVKITSFKPEEEKKAAPEKPKQERGLPRVLPRIP